VTQRILFIISGVLFIMPGIYYPLAGLLIAIIIMTWQWTSRKAKGNSSIIISQ
jgi:UPF0716 family protein affecting phage T7 exclusion